MAYTVSRRIPEIGLRMALGASARNILGLLLRDGLALTAVGLVAGLGLAAFATPMLSMFLAGVAPHDPMAFTIVGLAITATAALATYWPARRGIRSTPSDALRIE